MLRSWSAKNIGSVCLQLAIAKEIVLRLDAAQDIRSLAPHELALRRKAKLCSLGLHYKEHWLSSVHGSLTWPRGTPTQNFSTYRPVIGAGRGIFQNWKQERSCFLRMKRWLMQFLSTSTTCWVLLGNSSISLTMKISVWTGIYLIIASVKKRSGKQLETCPLTRHQGQMGLLVCPTKRLGRWSKMTLCMPSRLFGRLMVGVSTWWTRHTWWCVLFWWL